MTTSYFSDTSSTVRVQDDLYRHINGNWIASTEIPADKAMWGPMTILREVSQEACQKIITGVTQGGAPGSAEQLLADLYSSFMDEDRIEQLGATPLQEPLARVDQVTTLAEFSQLLGWMARHGLGDLFDIMVEAHPGDPSRYVAFFSQSGIGLPDESYYHDEDKAEIRTAYLAHIAAMLTLAGVSEAQTQAEAIFDLETKIAAHHWDLVRCRDLQAIFNPLPYQEFCASLSNLDFDAYCHEAKVSPEKLAELISCMPSFFAGLNELLGSVDIEVWRAWARWNIVSALAMCLSKDFVAEAFNFGSTILMGVPEIKPRWRRGVEFVEARLGDAVGQLYVEKHFPAEAKQRMEELVAMLLKAYQVSIENLDWMSHETKQEALRKLSKFRPKIGYPSKWKDYSTMEIRADDLVGNRMRTSAWATDYHMEKVGNPVDLEEWAMSPQTVNAYYHPLRNEIVFPAAILQPPFFDMAADDAVNYGAIGAVIGHEIGHGFDDQGSTCDGDGVLRNWWTETDREAFESRTKILIDQYNQLSPANTPGHFVNGELTIGENIGDLGGLGIAIKAWQLALHGQQPALINGLTGLQRLFFSWANVWRNLCRAETQIQLLSVDPHSPAEFRCNQIVRNVAEFYTAFDVQPTDKLWLDPDQRVTIW